MILFFSPFPVLERVAIVSSTATAPAPKILTCAGGIGIRAARSARASGTDSVTIAGFEGGRMGKLLTERLEAEGMGNALIHIATQTRGSILTIDKDRGGVSEILDAPQTVTELEWTELYHSALGLLPDARAVVVGARGEFGGESGFKLFLEAVTARDLPIIGDATGAAWEELLSHPVLFLHTDLSALQRTTEASLQHDSTIVTHIQAIIESENGARNVCVSLGDEGVLLMTRTEAWRVRAPIVSRYKPVGSDEALTGGFTARYLQTGDVLESVAYGCAFAATSVAHDIPAESTDGEARIVRRDVTIEPVFQR